MKLKVKVPVYLLDVTLISLCLSVIVADRCYNDFPMLNVWDSKGVNFVIRHKHNLAFNSIEGKNYLKTPPSMCSKTK